MKKFIFWSSSTSLHWHSLRRICLFFWFRETFRYNSHALTRESGSTLLPNPLWYAILHMPLSLSGVWVRVSYSNQESQASSEARLKIAKIPQLCGLGDFLGSNTPSPLFSSFEDRSIIADFIENQKFFMIVSSSRISTPLMCRSDFVGHSHSEVWLPMVAHPLRSKWQKLNPSQLSRATCSGRIFPS